MKASEFRALGVDELTKQIDAAHKELFDLRIKLSTRQLVNHQQIRSVRKKIAILETLKKEKELGIR